MWWRQEGLPCTTITFSSTYVCPPPLFFIETKKKISSRLYNVESERTICYMYLKRADLIKKGGYLRKVCVLNSTSDEPKCEAMPSTPCGGGGGEFT